MDQVRRIKRSEATWRELFARQVSSGMSVLEFCRSEKINPGVFRRWRSMLSGGIAAKKAASRTLSKAVTPFIDIGAVGAVGAVGARMEVRLELGGGVVLTVARG